MRCAQVLLVVFLALIASSLAQSNPAGLNFAPAAIYSGGGPYLQTAVPADVNGDGILDLVVAIEGGAVGVLLGNGDGTFQTAVVYSSGGTGAYAVAVADVNGDGKPDLLVANNCNSTCTVQRGSVGVLLGNGDGTFQSAITYYSGGYGPEAIAVADLNGDGKADVVVTNCGAGGGGCIGSSAAVLLGNGDGTLQPAVTYNAGANADSPSPSVSVADVNGDGIPDVIVASQMASNPAFGHGGIVSVLLGNGDGTLRAPLIYSSGGYAALSVAVADVNGDGKPDVVVASCITPQNCGGLVGILLGNGDGTFQTAVTYGSGGSHLLSLAVSDMNGDGKPDVVVANNNTNEMGSVGVLVGNGDGTFQTALTWNPGGYDTVSVAAADVNGDGKTDLISVNEWGTSQGGNNEDGIGVLLNTSLTPTTTALTPPQNPSYVGQLLTFTATVTVQPGFYKGLPPDGELVTFKDIATSPAAVLGTAPLSGGVATFATSTLSKGSHTIKVKYPGDANLTSSLAVATEAVERYPTTTSLTSSLNPSSLGQAVTFTATVTSSGPTPTGVVTFYKGKVVIGTAPLNSSGVAQFTTSTLLVGAHPMTASYAHDEYNAGSLSAVLDQTVN